MLLDPLPDINRMFSMVVQQEHQLSKDMAEESKILGNINVGNSKSAGKGKATGKNKVCPHYGK